MLKHKLVAFIKYALFSLIVVLFLFYKPGISNAIVPDGSPTNLSATVIAWNNIELTWQCNATNEAGFKIQRSTVSTFSTNTYTFTTYTPNVTTWSNTSSIVDGTVYYYRVAAYNGSDLSSWSNVVTVTSFLKTPTNFTATLDANKHAVLNWTDNTNYENNYIVEKKIGSGAYSTVITLGPRSNTGAMSYTDNSPGNGLITYRVKATKTTPNISESLYSNEASVLTAEIEIIKEAPAEAPLHSEMTYTLRVINHTDTQFNNVVVRDELPPQVGYISDNAGMTSTWGFTNIVTKTISLAPFETQVFEIKVQVIGTMAPPTELVAQPIFYDAVDLTWKDNADNEHFYGYYITTTPEIGPDDLPVYYPIGNMPKDENGYMHLRADCCNIVKDTTYYFRVFAINYENDIWRFSEPSNVAIATTNVESPIVAPSNLVATYDGAKVNLNWQLNSSIVPEMYAFERSTNPDFTQDTIFFDTSSNYLQPITSYSDPNILANRSYYYRVFALYAFRGSEYSNTASVETTN